MDAVNKLTYTEFIDKFFNVVEHCPIVAASLWSARPFASSNDLIEHFCTFIDSLPTSREYDQGLRLGLLQNMYCRYYVSNGEFLEFNV